MAFHSSPKYELILVDTSNHTGESTFHSCMREVLEEISKNSNSIRYHQVEVHLWRIDSEGQGIREVKTKWTP